MIEISAFDFSIVIGGAVLATSLIAWQLTNLYAARVYLGGVQEQSDKFEAALKEIEDKWSKAFAVVERDYLESTARIRSGIEGVTTESRSRRP